MPQVLVRKVGGSNIRPGSKGISTSMSAGMRARMPAPMTARTSERKLLRLSAWILARTASGSALVEVCVSVFVLCAVALTAAVAQQQALIALRYSAEYRRAVWIVVAAAESLRAGASNEDVEHEWGEHASRHLHGARLSIRSVAPAVDRVELSWRGPTLSGAAACAPGLACIAVPVAAGRRVGGRTW
jgi:Tfp pilus assembly protein PilV